MNQTLRWLAVLPGAILAGLLATFPLHWLLNMIFPYDGKWFLDFIEFPNKVLDVSAIELTLSPLIIALVCIWVGAEIAPKNKFKTALVLSALWVCVLLYIFLAAGGHATFDIKTACAVLGVLLGLSIVWLRVRNEQKGSNVVP
jgi:hypothetical protein